MKRTPATSAENFVKALSDTALGPLEVPNHVRLRAEDMPFWEAIIRSRAREEWNDATLVVAAQLARCLNDIERESALLQEEGTVTTNDRGTPIQNPRNAVISELARREMAFMRTLRMGGDVAGDTRDQIGRRRIEQEARRLREDIDQEGLLAS